MVYYKVSQAEIYYEEIGEGGTPIFRIQIRTAREKNKLFLVKKPTKSKFRINRKKF